MHVLQGLVVGSLSAILALSGQGAAISQPTPAGESGAESDPAALSQEANSAADLLRLNPNPDLLNVPRTEADVQIDVSKPITLEQAIELAKRNNRDLQVIELELERRREELKEARGCVISLLKCPG